jgi:hypothetical protein
MTWYTRTWQIEKIIKWWIARASISGVWQLDFGISRRALALGSSRYNRELALIMKHKRLCCWLGVVTLAMTTAGCSRHSQLSKLSINVSQAADSALAQYDTNHDGALAGDELTACPSIKSALASFDKNHDSRVDGEELRARFQSWLDSPTRLLMVPCVVTLDGARLSNAQVKLIPEKFLGDSLYSGEGVTNEDGFTGISISQADAKALGQAKASGVRLGLYRVEITHPTVKIPAKYNTNTTLGIEISPASAGSPIMFALSSR